MGSALRSNPVCVCVGGVGGSGAAHDQVWPGAGAVRGGGVCGASAQSHTHTLHPARPPLPSSRTYHGQYVDALDAQGAIEGDFFECRGLLTSKCFLARVPCLGGVCVARVSNLTRTPCIPPGHPLPSRTYHCHDVCALDAQGVIEDDFFE